MPIGRALFLRRSGLVASLAIALAATRAAAQTPVPVQEPRPRPVPVAPGSPPPSNEKTPYPVPVQPDPPANPPAAPANPPAAPANPPAAPANPPAPTPPANAPAPTPPANAPAPTPPANAPAPTTPTTPPPAAKPPAAPQPDVNLGPPAPIVPPKPAPMPITTTSVTSYPQTPLVGSATIKQILVDENTKTDDDTVILISKLEVGDSFTAEMAETVKAELISSGLFKDVTVYWSNVEGGVAVHLVVKDKHSWVIAPAFYTQPTNVGGGIGFGENNLFGQNQKLLVYGQVATGDTFFIGAWVIPSLGGTRFYAQLDTYLKSSRIIEYAAPTGYLDGAEPREVRESRMAYLNGGAKLGIELFRGFKIDARLRGARVSYKDVKLAEGATAADLGLADGAEIPAPGGEGWDVSNEWTVSIDRRANYYGIQSGYRVAVSYERALQSASDFDYTLTGFSFYRARKILARHNFVIRGGLNYGRDLPFQQEYVLGGTMMRGYVNNQFRGDLRALANVEYSVPLLSIQGFSVRGLAFFDSGYTTFLRTRDEDARRHYLPGAAARGADPFKNTIGVGTRLYLRQIVLPLLGLDFGYGLEARDLQIYLAIGLTD